MIPRWKIRREALRIWRQLAFIPMHPIEQARFRLHNAMRTDAHDVVIGIGAPTNKIAVFLIYQPKGLNESACVTCAHLVKAGYSVYLVSNARLAKHDIERARPFCTRIIQRPNHGYDFGGYKQAILEILDSDARPSRLLLLNDSIWFPLFKDCDLLERLEAMDADLAGPVYYDHRSEHRRHLQSYMVMFGPRAIESKAFEQFWRSYVMSNNKHRTIRNGEMRLTHACVSGGLKVAALRSAHEMPDLKTLGKEARNTVATYDTQRLKDVGQRRRKLRGDPDQREGCYILTNHPIVNLEVFNLSLLKKDSAETYLRQRCALFAPECGHIIERMHPTVRDEISEDLSRRTQSFAEYKPELHDSRMTASLQ